MFKKGVSGNEGGRPKGSLNKSNIRLRSNVMKFIESNLETMQSDFDKVQPEERLYFFEKLIGHSLNEGPNKLKEAIGDLKDIKRGI